MVVVVLADDAAKGAEDNEDAEVGEVESDGDGELDGEIDDETRTLFVEEAKELEPESFLGGLDPIGLEKSVITLLPAPPER